jgi:acyl-CoA synthetase (AMP-forming)/AMP-acid ligase II
MTMTPIKALGYQSQTLPERTAFVFHEEIWSYKRLAIEAERLARGLLAQGVAPGDRVVLHMVNRPEMIVAYYACFKMGAIAAPLRTAFKFAEIAPMLKRLRPALYIGETALYENVAPVDVSILPRHKRFVVNGTFEDDGVQPWGMLFDEDCEEDLMVSPASYEAAVLLNTSGTTGQPKFVVHTPATLAEMTELVVRHGGFSADELMLNPLPMGHMSGLLSLLANVRFGAPFILLESFDADAVLDTIERYRCTRYLGFPAQFAALLERQLARPRDLASLRLCMTGADVCPIDLQQQVTSVFGAPLYNLWGATETVGSMTFGLQPGPVVRVAKEAQIRLIDESGADVADGETGELLIRGANVFDRYWNDPKATDECLKAGWYHTGDLMRRGEGDELWFVARKKDIIIRGGTNISPVEVEEALVASHPAVEEAAVVGIPDAVYGQRVVGFVKLVDGAKDNVVSEILGKVGRRLASYKVPELLAIVDEFPRNPLSKLDRNALLAMAVSLEKTGGTRIEAVPARPDERPVRRVAGRR